MPESMFLYVLGISAIHLTIKLKDYTVFGNTIRKLIKKKTQYEQLLVLSYYNV